MRYKNPVIRGFHPDPSVCRANGKYYLAVSSFQYFPGVPLFESRDLVNWTQIGHALTRKSQVMLEGVRSSGGVFAPTLRYHAGRFYMVTTNDSTSQNFYVYADDIHGLWSEPVYVAQGGIDPSLLFDGERVYFISNGEADDGQGGITQCEIDIRTGEKLTPSRCIWRGAGGRCLESPHMYHIGDRYYLFAAEGGTEYGHMVVCARSMSPWGPFENCPHNPILTNRNQFPSVIQGIGHGDLVQDDSGAWHILTLGFRQIHPWHAYHTLGREVFLMPVRLGEDGWFTVGKGFAEEEYDLPGDFSQERKQVYTFENTRWDVEWCYLRHPHPENYQLLEDAAVLRGSAVTLDEAASPTFIGLRQTDFQMNLAVEVAADGGEGGVTIYMSELEHYDLAVRRTGDGFEAVLRLNIGGVRHEACTVPLKAGRARLTVSADSQTYRFFIDEGCGTRCLGQGMSKYLSSEVSGGFTGVMLGLYAVGDGNAEFRSFQVRYGTGEEGRPYEF